MITTDPLDVVVVVVLEMIVIAIEYTLTISNSREWRTISKEEQQLER